MCRCQDTNMTLERPVGTLSSHQKCFRFDLLTVYFSVSHFQIGLQISRLVSGLHKPCFEFTLKRERSGLLLQYLGFEQNHGEWARTLLTLSQARDMHETESVTKVTRNNVLENQNIAKFSLIVIGAHPGRQTTVERHVRARWADALYNRRPNRKLLIRGEEIALRCFLWTGVGTSGGE